MDGNLRIIIIFNYHIYNIYSYIGNLNNRNLALKWNII